MMARTHIPIDGEHHGHAKVRAADLGIPFADDTHRQFDRDLSEPLDRSEPTRVFDLGDSGGTDVASKKDRMLGETTGALRRPRPFGP